MSETNFCVPILRYPSGIEAPHSPGVAVIGGVALLNNPGDINVNGLLTYKHSLSWKAPCRCLVYKIGLWLVEADGYVSPPTVGVNIDGGSSVLDPITLPDSMSEADRVFMYPGDGMWRMFQKDQSLNIEVTSAAVADSYVMHPLVIGFALPA